MKTLNKLVFSLILLSCLKDFALDLNFVNYFNVKNYFSKFAAYNYRDNLKTLASKLKNKSVDTKNYLVSKFSKLKSKLQGINNKKKKGFYAGALALASGAAYLAYKKYKHQNNLLENKPEQK